eukprot:4811316-Prymnesium_polylepis.1
MASDSYVLRSPKLFVMRAVLALDAGTSAAKAVLVARDQRGWALLSEASSTHAPPRGTAGAAEQDAEDWWYGGGTRTNAAHLVLFAPRDFVSHRCRQSASSAIRSLRIDLSGIAAISLSGQMQSVLLVDAHGSPLRPALLYSDSRASAEAAELELQFGREALEARTLNWKGAVSILPKLLWLQRHEPEAIAAAAAIVLAAHDLLYLRLTGGHVTDRTNASTTGLLTSTGD